jgi:hypothetical protein
MVVLFVILDELKIYDQEKSKSVYGKPLLAKIKLTVKPNQIAKNKKLDYEQKVRARAAGREILYDIENYLENKYGDFVLSFTNRSMWPMEFVPSKLSALELNNCSFGILSLFNLEFGPYEIKPSFKETELKLKQRLQYSVTKLGEIPQLSLSHGTLNNRELNLTRFDGSMESLKAGLDQLDETLAELAEPLIAFIFIMRSFNHLLQEKGTLLAEEAKLLVEKNELGALQTEATALVRDKKLLLKIPRTLRLPPYQIDLSEPIKFMLVCIDESISILFSPNVQEKFDGLLVLNKDRFLSLRERILKPITEIEEYIDMKRFLEGEDITKEIQQIKDDIKLCRALSKFEEDIKRTSVLISNEYLESLGWVNELCYHHEGGIRRVKEALPRFIEELSRMQVKLLEEFNQTLAYIREFDLYTDDKEAETYYLKARELNATLDDYIRRAADINNKQEILGVKKTNFDSTIIAEKTKFTRYMDLWSFICNEWNPEHNNWKREPFVKLDKGEMNRVVSEGVYLLQKLQSSFRDNETILRFVKNKLDEVNKFHTILEIVKILKDQSFKERHWEELFNIIKEADKNDSLGLKEGKPDLQKITLGQLMLANIVSHLSALRQIHARANTEAKTEQRIKEIRHSVEGISIKPTVYDLDNSGLSIITGIKGIISKLSEHHAMCTSMLSNPDYPEEFTRDLRSLAKLVFVSVDVFSLVQIIQNKLIKFSPIFKFRDLERYVQKKDTPVIFTKLREDFKKFFNQIEERKMKIFIDIIGTEDEDIKISDMVTKLQNFDKHCDYIISNLSTVFKEIRNICPRFNFCTDEQMMALCSLIKFPKSFLAALVPLFQGLSSIAAANHLVSGETEKFEIPSVSTKRGEIIKFDRPLLIDLAAPAKIPLISVVDGIEASLKSYLEKEFSFHLQVVANYHFDFTLIYKYWQDKLLMFQTLQLCLQVLFDFEISMLGAISRQTSSGDSKGFDTSISFCSRLENLRKRIFNGVKQFVQYPIRFMRGKMRDHATINEISALIQIAQNMISVLDSLITKNLTSPEDFNFLSLPKYSMTFIKKIKVHKDNEQNIAFDEMSEKIASDLKQVMSVQKQDESSRVLSLSSHLPEQIFIGKSGATLVLSMFNMHLPYRYEIIPPGPVSYPMCGNGFIFSIFHSVNIGSPLCLVGPKGQGKSSTIRCLAQKLGQSVYEVDGSLIAVSEGYMEEFIISKYVKGALACGLWFMANNLEKAPPSSLSILAILAEEVISCMNAPKRKGIFAGEEITARLGASIFCSYNFMNHSSSASEFKTSSLNLSHKFRIITLHHPDYIEIVLGLLVLVCDKPEDKTKLANKIVLFCKILNAKMGTSLPSLSIRMLISIINKSLMSYFSSLQTYYDTFKDKDGKERLDSNVLCIDIGREERFVHFFREEIQAWAQPWIKHHSQLSQIHSLFDRCISEPVPLANQAVKDQTIEVASLQKILALYKEIDVTATLPESTLKGTKLIEPYVNRLLSSHQRITIILGQPMTQKSNLIKLASFAQSELTQTKFRNFWINLEVVSTEDLFGTYNADKTALQNSEGIIKELLIQSNCINLEDKTSSSSSKINMLLQNASELYSTMSDPRAVSEIKNKKNFERDHSWIIFDGSCSKLNFISKHDEQQADSKISAVFSTFNGLLSNNPIMTSYIGFSNKTKVIFELNSLNHLEPSSISSANIIYLPNSILSADDRIMQWNKALSKEHQFFRSLQNKIGVILSKLIHPIILEIDAEKHSPSILWYTSHMAILNNFLGLYEIMLNEFRKFHVAYGLSEAKQNPEQLLNFKAISTSHHIVTSALSGLIAGGGGAGDGHHLKSGTSNKGQEFNSGSLHASPLALKRTAKYNDEDQVGNLSSKEDIEEFEVRKLEGLALFCLTSVISTLIHGDKYGYLTELVERQASVYCGQVKHSKTAFADGLFKLIADKKLSGSIIDLSKYLYDFSKGKWITWDTLRFPNKIEVSSSFSSNNFSKTELLRLNCKSSPAFIRAENSLNDGVFSFSNYVESTLLPTAANNKMRYMIDLLLNYKRHITLIGDRQQGKTEFLTHYLKDIVEQREVVGFRFAMDASLLPKTVQLAIEYNLMKVGSNTISPPEGRKILVWIEDLQLNTQKEKVYSLVRSIQTQNGWYSSSQKSFVGVQDCCFLMTCSLTKSSPHSSKEIIQSINPDVLWRTHIVSSSRLDLEELKTIFFDLVKTHIDPNPVNSKERLISNLFGNLVKVFFYNQTQLKLLSHKASTNLTLSTFIQHCRSLNLIEWESIAEEQSSVFYAWIKTLKNLFSGAWSFKQMEIIRVAGDKLQSGAIKFTPTEYQVESTQREKIRKSLLGRWLEGDFTLASPDCSPGSRTKHGSAFGSGRPSLFMLKAPSAVFPSINIPSVVVVPPPPETDAVIHEEEEDSKQSSSSGSMNDTGERASRINDLDRMSNSDGRRMDSPDHGPIGLMVPGKVNKMSRFSLIPVPEHHDAPLEIRSVSNSPKSRDGSPHTIPNFNARPPSAKSSKASRRSSVGMLSPESLPSQFLKNTLHANVQVNIPSARRKSMDIQIHPEDLTMEGRSIAASKRGSSSSSNESDEYKSHFSRQSKKSRRDSDQDIILSRKSIGMAISNVSDEEVKQRFQVSGHKHDNSALLLNSLLERSILAKSIDANDPTLQELLLASAQEMKHLFDETLLKEIRELRDMRDDVDDHAFVIADPKTEKEIMDYMKLSIKNQIRARPEMLPSLKIEASSICLFLQDYTQINLAMMTDYQQIWISCYRNSFYIRCLLSFICGILGNPTETIDILYDFGPGQIENKVKYANFYEALVDNVVNNFQEVWKLKRRYIIVAIPDASLRSAYRSKLEKALNLISSIVLNTENIYEAMNGRFKELMEVARKERLYSHYSDYELQYAIKNRLQAKLTFIVINDCTDTFYAELQTTYKSHLAKNSQSRSVFRYLCEHYPSLHSRFSKYCISNMKHLTLEEAPAYFSTPLPVEESSITPLFASILTAIYKSSYRWALGTGDVPGAYLHQRLAGVGRVQDSVILFNAVRTAIRIRLDIQDSEGDSNSLAREVQTIVGKFSRRKEILVLEIKEILNQIQSKTKEEDDIELSKKQLLKRREDWVQKKNECDETHSKLLESIETVNREEALVEHLKHSLQDTLSTVQEYREVDIQMNFIQGAFSKTQLFAAYSVIFVELFKIQVTYPISDPDLVKLSEETVDRVKLQGYIETFEEICVGFHSNFIPMISSVLTGKASGQTTGPKVNNLSSIIHTLAGSPNAKNLNAFQKVLFKMIDTAVEIIKLDLAKGSRDAERSRLQDSLALLAIQTDKAKKAIKLIDDGLEELPLLTGKIKERMEFLNKKKKLDEEAFKDLELMALDLTRYQGKYTNLSQPLLSPTVSRESLLEFLSSYIVVCSKLPWKQKKSLAYNILKEASLPATLFEELSLHRIFSSDTLLTDLIKMRVPCNINFMINLAISDLIQDEQTLLYILVIDPCRLLLRYFMAKYQKTCVIDRGVPSSITVDSIEQCIKNGNIYIAVDPGHELRRIIKPVLDWQYRRYMENILISNGQNIELTDNIEWQGKKIHVNKGFFLYIVCENMKLEELESEFLNKVIVLNNSVDDPILFCETFADEMTCSVESVQRSYLTTEFINNSTNAKFVKSYKELVDKCKDFDVLKENLEGAAYINLKNSIDSFQLLVETLDREVKERKQAQINFRNSLKTLFPSQYNSTKLLSATTSAELDLAMQQKEAFLIAPFGYLIPGYTKMIMRHLGSAAKVYPYYQSLDLLPENFKAQCSLTLDGLLQVARLTVTPIIDKNKITIADIEKRNEIYVKIEEALKQRVYLCCKSAIGPLAKDVYEFVLSVVMNSQIIDASNVDIHVSKDGWKNAIKQLLDSKLGVAPSGLKQESPLLFAFYESMMPRLPGIKKLNTDFGQLRELIASTSQQNLKFNSSNQDEAANKLKTLDQINFQSRELVPFSSQIYPKELRHKISIHSNSLVPTPSQLRNFVLAKRLLSQLDWGYADMKPLMLGGKRLNYDQIIALTHLLTSVTREPLVLEINYNGDTVSSFNRTAPVSGSPTKRHADLARITSRESIGSIEGGSEKPGNENVLQNENSPNNDEQIFIVDQAEVRDQNKISLMGLKKVVGTMNTVKKASDVFIESITAKRALQKTFLNQNVEYAWEVFRKVFNFEESEQFNSDNTSWGELIFSPKTHIAPQIDHNLTEWDMHSLLNLYKLLRPDLLRDLISRTQTLCKWQEPLDPLLSPLESYYQYSTSKRINAVVLPSNDSSLYPLYLLISKVGQKVDFVSVSSLIYKTREASSEGKSSLWELLKIPG